MKKLIVGFVMILFLTACSSGEPKTIDEAVKDVAKENYKIEENANGKVSVTITDNKAHEGSKRAFNKKSAQILANLHNLDVPAASIQWHAKLTDSQGHEEIKEVYGLNFEEKEFDSVNWDNYKKVDLEQSATATRQDGALK